MGLIDIAKLNAEVDKLIDAQNTEIKQMNSEMHRKTEEKWTAMVTDLIELQTVARQISGEQEPGITVPTDICWGISEQPKITIIFNHYGMLSIGLTGGTYIGQIPYKGSYDYAKNHLRHGNWAVNLEYVVNKWRDQYPEFEKRFEDACIKYIKRKAEEANKRYESTKNTYEGRM